MGSGVWGSSTRVEPLRAVLDARALRQRLALSLRAAVRDINEARNNSELRAVVEQERELLQQALEVLLTPGAGLPNAEAKLAEQWLQSLENAIARADDPPGRRRNRSLKHPAPEPAPEAPSSPPEPPEAAAPVNAPEARLSRRGKPLSLLQA